MEFLNKAESSQVLRFLAETLCCQPEQLEYRQRLVGSTGGYYSWMIRFRNAPGIDWKERPRMKWGLLDAKHLWCSWNDLNNAEAIIGVLRIVSPAIQRLAVEELLFFDTVSQQEVAVKMGATKQLTSKYLKDSRGSVYVIAASKIAVSASSISESGDGQIQKMSLGD